MKKGGDPFVVQVVGPRGPVPSTLKDNNDGTYSVEYQPNDAGKHVVNVTLKGKNIKDAPFTVFVKEGADSGNTFIESFSFVIQARTKQNNNCKEGGEQFKVSITKSTGQEVQNVKTQDNGNGLYTVSYKLPSEGDYSIGVQLNGKNIKGSPFRQQV